MAAPPSTRKPKPAVRKPATRKAPARKPATKAARAAAKPAKQGPKVAPAARHRVFGISFASVYPLYVEKAERKGRRKEEVDEAIRWLTGYTQKGLEAQIRKGTDFEAFLAEAPAMNPARSLITGVVCGVRVEEIEDATMQGIRYIDKLVDEIANGRPMEKVLRSPP